MYNVHYIHTDRVEFDGENKSNHKKRILNNIIHIYTIYNIQDKMLANAAAEEEVIAAQNSLDCEESERERRSGAS